ncbi:MFS transporter [Dactylosporangium sp. NPDC048998]|uniref:MFS transporter n=1 Tax=Dactylosporangium sp. NPDC048998 TaxID=3363976 RepID=UPI00371A5A15
MLEHRRANLALAALSISTFTFVTTEVLPVGLLTLMADDLHRSRSQVGLLMTGYAAVVVLMSMPLARLTQRVPRRLLLGVTLGVFSAATLVTALAPGYGVLLGARLVVGLTQALFWSVVGSTATGLFPPSQRGRTVARMSMGAALAPVLGVPIGTWLGQQAGWRFAFLVMAAIGVATCAVVVTLLPGRRTPQSETASRGGAPNARRYLLLVLCTAIGVTGAVTAQTYVTPYLLDVTGFAPATLGPVLLVTGTAGFLGTVVVGRFLDRYPWLALVTPMALVAVALLALYSLGTLKPAAIAALALGGFAFSAMAAAVQNRTLQVAPGSTDLASAGTGSAFNVGIATGSFLGGLIIDRMGVHAVALAGALITAAAVALLLTEPRLARADPESHPDTGARQHLGTASEPATEAEVDADAGANASADAGAQSHTDTYGHRAARRR